MSYFCQIFVCEGVMSHHLLMFFRQNRIWLCVCIYKSPIFYCTQRQTYLRFQSVPRMMVDLSNGSIALQCYLIQRRTIQSQNITGYQSKIRFTCQVIPDYFFMLIYLLYSVVMMTTKTIQTENLTDFCDWTNCATTVDWSVIDQDRKQFKCIRSQKWIKEENS